LLQPLDLNFGHCKIAVAGKRGDAPPEKSGNAPPNSCSSEFGGASPDFSHPTIRVATKYPRITLDYYNSRGIPVEIIPLSGSIELAPLIGLADRIVDLVE